MIRGCSKCGAYFQDDTDIETLSVLQDHLEKCTEEKHYTDDPNVKGYIDL